MNDPHHAAGNGGAEQNSAYEPSDREALRISGAPRALFGGRPAPLELEKSLAQGHGATESTEDVV
jgi:hypothetical protein